MHLSSEQKGQDTRARANLTWVVVQSEPVEVQGQDRHNFARPGWQRLCHVLPVR